MEVSLHVQFSALLTANGSKQLNGNGGVRHARAVCDAGSALGAHVSRDDGGCVQHKARV